MPFPYAGYFIGFVLLTIIVGFWSSYFVPIAEVPTAFHVHAFTATSWVGLLLVQNWSIRHGRRDLHRIGGILSLLLFPFLIVGFVMIINVTATAFAANEGEIVRLAGPSFALSMVFAIVAYLILYYLALKHRNNVRLHAGYMLTTPIVLFESPFSRIIVMHLPFLVFTGSDFPQSVLDAIVISMGMAIVFSLGMYLRDRRSGTPFLLCAVLILVQAVTMYVGTYIQWVREGLEAYARVPEAASLLCGFALGAAVSFFGWTRHGRKAAKAKVRP